MKRAILVHGWGGTPDAGWFSWLARELKSRGFEVVTPQLPDTDHPRIENWVPALRTAVGAVDADTYFIGHSMGCQTIARLLEALPQEVKAGGAVYVAGFFKRLTGLENDPEVQAMDRHWLTTPLDLAKVREHCPQSVALFSDDDPYVPLENVDDFRDRLGSEVSIEHGMRHFSQSSSSDELPLILDAVLRLSGSK